ncbi:MAG: FliI/YscN family ATPase [Myxococcota bacterium]
MSLVDLSVVQAALRAVEPVVSMGRVTRVQGLLVEATLPEVAVGTTCDIRIPHGKAVRADVVGFQGSHALLMSQDGVQGIHAGCPVVARPDGDVIPVGEELLGRIVNSRMEPMDGKPLPVLKERALLQGRIPPAMLRRRVAKPLCLGIRVIDTLLTCGEGQRVGIMAGPGVGKSVLLGMLARNADADVIVMGLVGERGREVREFVERDLRGGLARSVVVVATGDEAPLLRIRAALCATAIAEHFRAKGLRVLLLVDSLTRVAMAQREIGLAAGEPPTSKGYPPSVFALLPRLLERAGNDDGKGAITALYTVLAEGDDLSDPVADAARAALDGHIVLSRALAGAGHFPAVDVQQSVSRVMNDIVDKEHRELARQAREVMSAYREAAPLIDVGAYAKGTNPRVDRALECIDALNAFTRQDSAERTTLLAALTGLRQALQGRGHHG